MAGDSVEVLADSGARRRCNELWLRLRQRNSGRQSAGSTSDSHSVDSSGRRRAIVFCDQWPVDLVVRRSRGARNRRRLCPGRPDPVEQERRHPAPSSRKRAEEALTASERLFRSIFENAQIGIGVYKIETQEHLSNRALQEMLGYSGEQLSRLEQWKILGSAVIGIYWADVRMVPGARIASFAPYLSAFPSRRDARLNALNKESMDWMPVWARSVVDPLQRLPTVPPCQCAHYLDII